MTKHKEVLANSVTITQEYGAKKIFEIYRNQPIVDGIDTMTICVSRSWGDGFTRALTFNLTPYEARVLVDMLEIELQSMAQVKEDEK